MYYSIYLHVLYKYFLNVNLFWEEVRGGGGTQYGARSHELWAETKNQMLN